MLGRLRAYIIYVSKLSLQKCLENAGISPAMSCSITNFFADVAVQKEVSGAALEVTLSCQTSGYTFVKSMSEYIGGKQ